MNRFVGYLIGRVRDKRSRGEQSVKIKRGIDSAVGIVEWICDGICMGLDLRTCMWCSNSMVLVVAWWLDELPGKVGVQEMFRYT